MGIRTKSTLAGLAILAVTACSSGTDTDTGETTAPTQDAVVTSEAPVTTTEPTESTVGSEPGESMATDASPDSSASSGTTAMDADLANVDFDTDAQAAINKSTDEVGDGIVHGIEIEWDDDYSAWVWSVKILVDTTDNEVKVNADTGEILATESDDTDDTEEAIDLTSPMTPEEAQQKALDEQDGAIRSWKLEWDDGRREYQFDIGDMDNTTEVTIDVETGEATLD